MIIKIKSDENIIIKRKKKRGMSKPISNGKMSKQDIA